MIPPALRLTSFLAIVFSLLTFAPWPSSAAENSSGARALNLEIIDGKIANSKRNGEVLPATLREIVAILGSQYPDVSVTFAGIDDLLIPNLTLHIAPRPAALDMAFAALAEASGHRFRAQRYGEADILLMPDDRGGPTRAVEVFNLSPLLYNHAEKLLGDELRALGDDLDRMRQKYGDQHPDVAAAKSRIERLAARRDSIVHSAPERDKVVAQITEIVSRTAHDMKSSEKDPEFHFHPGSNLLVVIGGWQSIDITRKIIAAMEKNPQ